LLWLLPTPLAGRFRRLLGDGVPMVLPGRLDRVPPAAVDEVVAWLAGAAGVAPKAARRLLREAGSDLRVLAAALERCVGQRAPDVREDELRAVAQHDLEALGARHAISLMAVAGATHQLPLKSLRAGLVAAEDLDAPQAGGGTIRLVQAGDTLDEKTVRAIRRELGGRSRVLMRGTPIRGRLSLQPGRAALREFVGNLEEVCRHLETAGLGHIQAGFLHVAPLYEEAVVQAIGDADTLQEAFAALRRGATLLDGIVLERLHNVTRADARVLTGDRHTDLELLRLVGETWRDVRRNAAPVQPTCRSLAERLSGQAAVVLSPEEGSPHLSLFRELPAGRARLLGLGEPDGRGAYGAYLAVCNVTDRPPEGLASLLGKVLAGEADARPALVLLGPGVDLWPSQEQGPGVAVLDELDLKRILQAPSVEEAFWRTVRAHTGLRALSPFRHVGALPEGSPMFVGRRELLERIARELAQRSFLVVGSRQIGKTSLINQLLHEAKLREDVRLVYLDTQGIRSGGELQHRLLEHVPAARREALAALPPIEVMRSLARSAREEGRTAVFLLNEADGIAYRDRPLMQGMRGMHDEGLARFLLVGHTTIVHELRRPASPLFHMTEGRAGEAAVNLGELESEAALELIDKLEERPLGLGWVNEHERKEGRRLLLRRTYRIPWVIQDTCGRLVRLLDGERRGELRLDDVRRVTEQVQPLLEHLHDTEFDTILGRGHEGLADDAVRAVLSALTHRRYCTRGRFSDQSDPGDEPPTEQHAFTSSQALEIMLEEVEARYQPRASALLSDYLRHFPYERLLRGLSLTLIISPLPDQSMGGKPRYCFQNHIYPEELRLAQRRKDRTPLDRLASALEGLRTRLGR